MHPALRIQLYLLSALALPGLNFFALAVAAVCLPLGFRARLGAMLRLTWRARWLFLLLGLGYAYGLPGPAYWPLLRDWSPSLPGLQMGGLQMLRLLLLLWLLDVLVVGMGAQRMMAGLHSLFSGLRWLGFPAERTTVRLGLTLQAMESNSLRLKDLTEMLKGLPTRGAGPAGFTLKHEPWRARDSLVLLAALAALIGTWLA
ncbi:MAG: hypothetical protein PHR30_16085 [Gallionellaceae bacterium]|nr:hypothetical protein [Gallionellaceae bacterium]